MCVGLMHFLSLKNSGKILKNVKPVSSKTEILNFLAEQLSKIEKKPVFYLTGGTGICGSGSISVCF